MKDENVFILGSVNFAICERCLFFSFALPTKKAKSSVFVAVQCGFSG